MILNKSVTPCENEVSVKSYLCTQFDSKLFGIKADGYLEVTNRRLLFLAEGKSIGGSSAIHSEVAISEVAEIKIYRGTTFSLPIFLTGLALALMISAGIKALLLSMFYNSPGIGTFLAFAFFCFAMYRVYFASKKRAFSMVIDTKGGSGNVVYIAGLSPFSGGNKAAARALTAEPGRDSEVMMKEIGAIIHDIQDMGENGVAKWQKKA